MVVPGHRFKRALQRPASVLDQWLPVCHQGPVPIELEKRLGDESAFVEIEPGEQLPGEVTAHAVGKPRRHEMPLHLPSHDALVFGDAVAETGGRLVVWATDRVDAKAERFYRDRFNPTLEPLLELPFDAVLTTHGQPVLKQGKQALRRALGAKPWNQRG